MVNVPFQSEYPTKNRATQGVISIKVSERNGKVVGAIQVEETDQIMMITNAGTLVRTEYQKSALWDVIHKVLP